MLVSHSLNSPLTFSKHPGGGVALGYTYVMLLDVFIEEVVACFGVGDRAEFFGEPLRSLLESTHMTAIWDQRHTCRSILNSEPKVPLPRLRLLQLRRQLSLPKQLETRTSYGAIRR